MIEQIDGQSAVNWSVFDFALAFVLLIAAGFSLEVVIRKVQSKRRRVLTLLGIFFTLAIIWAELAVGLFNSPFAGD